MSFKDATKLGSATITITASQTDTFAKATKTVKVTTVKGQPVLNGETVQSHNLSEGQFALGITPSEPVELTYSVDDSSVATVDSQGIVTLQDWSDGSSEKNVRITVSSKATEFFKEGNKVVVDLIIRKSTVIAPVDLSAGQWFALEYPGHWKPEWFQLYATDWNLPGDADNGLNVYAIADGVVEYTSTDSGSVRIRHSTKLVLKNGYTIPENTWFSWYGHMKEIVPNGTTVKQGQVIGKISCASADNNHLHFSVYAANEPWGSPAYGISPYWIAGPLSVNSLYADDIYGTREGILSENDVNGNEDLIGKNVYDGLLLDDSRMPSN